MKKIDITAFNVNDKLDELKDQVSDQSTIMRFAIKEDPKADIILNGDYTLLKRVIFDQLKTSVKVADENEITFDNCLEYQFLNLYL